VIKIYGHKMKYQSKNKNIFKIMITPKKAKKINKSYRLFSNQSDIEG
jgi:hypothetical protein